MATLQIITALSALRTEYFEDAALSIVKTSELLRQQGGHELRWSVCVDGPEPSRDVTAMIDHVTASATLCRLGAHMGVSVARNTALSISKAPPTSWVMAVDGDDIVDASGMCALAQRLASMDAKNSRLTWVGTNRLELSGEPPHYWTPKERYFEPGELNRVYAHPFSIHPNNVIYHAASIDSIGGWPATPGGEDLALLLRVAKDHPGMVSPEVTLRYRRWPGQVTATESFLDQRPLRYEYYERCDLLAGRSASEMRRPQHHGPVTSKQQTTP